MKTATDKTNLRIDSVVLGELSVDIISNPQHPVLNAKFAYLDSTRGTRHGFFNKSLWSPEIWAKFNEFVEVLEAAGLEESFGQTPSTGGGSVFTDTTDGIPGL